MRFDGNKYFKIGLLILLVGLELRYVETFVLNTAASRFVREKFDSPPAKVAVFVERFFPTTSSFQQQTFEPPKWIGLALISVGAVLILHSFVAKKQE